MTAPIDHFPVAWLRSFLRSLRRHKTSRRFAVLLLATVMAISLYWLVTPLVGTAEPSKAEVFEQIWQTVNDRFLIRILIA